MRKRGFCPKVLLKKWKKWLAGTVLVLLYVFASIGFMQSQQSLYVLHNNAINISTVRQFCLKITRG